MKALSIATLIAALAPTVDHAGAADCQSINPARERKALATFLKQNGYNQKQIAFSLRYADGKAKAWQKLPLTQRGEQCGVRRIGGMIYGCMIDFLPSVLSPSVDMNRVITDKEYLEKVGVGKVTVAEALAVGAASACQAGAIEAFADPKSW